MAQQSYESGQRPTRLEFVRETTTGEFNADPEWLLYSDAVTGFEPAAGANITPQDVLGDPDSAGSYPGTEEPEATVTYDLQQWLIDGSGDALDAAYDALERDADNKLPNSHTVVRRIEQTALDADNTVSGNAAKDTRQYWVGTGGRVDEAVLVGDPSEGGPVSVELTYLFESLRPYQIDQPDSATVLFAKSSDAGDTDLSLTIEDEGGATSSTITLDSSDATTAVSTTETFDNIDAVELAEEASGTVTIGINEGDDQSITEGDALCEIRGAADYDGDTGDLGVPALGSGSHASAIDDDYELLLDGDAVELPSGSRLGENLTSVEASVANNVEQMARAATNEPAVAAGKRECEVEGTVFGETEEFSRVMEMLTTNPMDFAWTFTDGANTTGTLTFEDMVITEVGASEEPHQAMKEVDVTIGQQSGVTIS